MEEKSNKQRKESQRGPRHNTYTSGRTCHVASQYTVTSANGLAVACEHVARPHAPKDNASRRLGPDPSPRDALCFLSGLAHIIHERCCCNRGFAAATRLRLAGSPLAPSTYCFKYALGPRGSACSSHNATARFRHEPSGIDGDLDLIDLEFCTSCHQ